MKTQLSQRSSEKLSDDLKYNLFGTSFPLSNYIFSVWSGGRRPKAEAAASGQMVYSPQSSPPDGLVQFRGSVMQQPLEELAQQVPYVKVLVLLIKL